MIVDTCHGSRRRSRRSSRVARRALASVTNIDGSSNTAASRKESIPARTRSVVRHGHTWYRPSTTLT